MKASEVKERLHALGVRPSRRWGQHFLLREDVADRMVAAGGIGPGETVLEVGPGLGILTERLLAAGHRVVAVERDRRLAADLANRFPTLELIEGDILEVPLPDFDRVVSNLPYEISSPLVLRLLDRPFRRMVLTFQRAFARRMTATPGSGDYSRLTVKVAVASEAELLWTVPASAFYPPPRVESAVVRLEPRAPPFPVDAPFHRVVDALFAHRRKRARNALKLAPGLGVAPAEVDEALEGVPLADRRPGSLSPAEMAELRDRLFPGKG